VSKAIFWKLVVPFCALSAAFLAAHALWDWDGVLLNAATEVAGIIITVAYVDWVIRRHEQDRWVGTQDRINARLAAYVNSVVSSMRSTFDIPFEALNQAEMWSNDVGRAQVELDRYSESTIEPNLERYVSSLDPQGWERLARRLQSISVGAAGLLDRFSSQLSPAQTELLLDIETASNQAPFLWQVFPEIAGAAPDDLPETSTPPEVLQASGNKQAANEIRRMLVAARNLRDA